MDKNKYTTYKNSYAAAKVVLRRKFIALNTYIKTEEKTQINDLRFHHRKSEKEEH